MAVIREVFEEEVFKGGGRSVEKLLELVNSRSYTTRIKAARRAEILLLERGYFNGEITQEIDDICDEKITVRAVLICFGLPHNNET